MPDNLVELGIEISKNKVDYVGYLKNDTNKQYIYSKYNPRKTANELIDFKDANRETVWIVFGIGLGYVADEILQVAQEDARIIMIEPTEALFEQQKTYITHLLHNSHIQVFYGDKFNKLKQILETQVKVKDINNIKLVVQPIYRSYFKSYYDCIFEILREYIEDLKVTYNTLTAFAYTNLENVIKNKEGIINSYDLRECKDLYKGTPAVIVSAGPSLAKNINELKDFKGIVFTGTRTLKNIKQAGGEADFLVCVDPQEIASEVMGEYKKTDIPLIATEEASPEVVKNNTSKKYFVRGMANGLSQTLYGVDVPQLPLYGSVTTLCLSAAKYMGCSPIIFIGQDLAYTEEKAHVDDFKSYKVDLQDEQIRYVEGINGTMLPTDVTLLLFLRWIEAFIEENNEDTEYINCTEGGANIRGARNAIFKETILKYQQSSPKLDTYKKVDYEIDKKEKLVIEINDYMKILDKGIEYANELYEHYKLSKESHRINELTTLLEEVNHRLLNSNNLIEIIATIEQLKIEVDLNNKLQFSESTYTRKLKKIRKTIDIYSKIYTKLQENKEKIEV